MHGRSGGVLCPTRVVAAVIDRYLIDVKTHTQEDVIFCFFDWTGKTDLVDGQNGGISVEIGQSQSSGRDGDG